MEFKDRFKSARKHAKLSQVELAKRAGVDQTTISNLERGKHRGTSHAIAIAAALGVNPRWLATGQGEMFEGSGASQGDELIFHKTELVEGHTPLAPDEIELPCFREVEFAAGDGRTQVIENYGHSMRFSLSRLSRAGVQPDQGACATIAGTSMEPTIRDGSPIAIDKGCKNIIDGKIYAIDHGGMLRVKRVYRLPLNRIRLVSDNAAEYPEEVHALGHEDSPHIIGRVFWWEVFD
ncbi:XRE family transcriptional regulator [Halomonas sp. WWR20]